MYEIILHTLYGIGILFVIIAVFVLWMIVWEYLNRKYNISWWFEWTLPSLIEGPFMIFGFLLIAFGIGKLFFGVN